MANLFPALRKSSADELASQVALLENVSTYTALAPYGQQAGKLIAQAINRVRRSFQQEILIPEPTVVEMKDRVQASFSANRTSPPEELLARIRKSCCERLKLPTTETDIMISVKVIHEAAALYKIDDWLTPAEQAEAVSQRYQEEILADLRKTVIKAKESPREWSDLTGRISAAVQSLSREEQEKIQRDAKLDDLSGDALLNALVTGAGPFASISALSAAGFGAYLALTTIIHAVATTLLGITLPFAVYTGATSFLSLLTGPIGWGFCVLVLVLGWRSSGHKLSRSLFAGLVALASQSPDFIKPSSLTPASISLEPSEIDEAAKKAEVLQYEESRAERSVQAIAERIKQEDETHKRAAASSEREKRKAETARRMLAEAVSPSAGEIERWKRRVVEAENAAIAEMSKAERHQRRSDELTLEKHRAQKERDNARIRRLSFEDGEGKKLLDLWSIHFPKMVFERQPVRWAIHRTHRERMSLERKLTELHNCEDPVALSRGKIRSTGEHHLKFRLETVECRMNYRLEGGRIFITRLGTNQQMHS